MRSLILTLSLLSGLLLATGIQPAHAQSLLPSETPVATAPAEIATPAATVNQQLQEKKDQDITETTGQKKGKLAAYLDENPPTELSWHNFIQHALHRAVSQGLPANIVVLLILFPAITSFIAFSRHIIGFQGFGIYIPAVLSVAFVSTGISTGIIMFATVLLAAAIFRRGLKYLKLQYLPRTAMLLWGVSLSTLGVLIAASFVRFESLLTVSIFPVLIIILLTENFMETQLMSSQSKAVELTLETLAIAIICSLIIGAEGVQKAVILNPEVTIASVAVVNYIIGKYSGLRLMEYIRFKNILED